MAVHQRTATTDPEVDRNPEEAFAIDSIEAAVAADLVCIAIVNHTLTATTTVAIGSLRKPFDRFGGSTVDHFHFVS